MYYITESSEFNEAVLNRSFECPFCSCFFFSKHDLALHLRAFSDVGDAHKSAFVRLHEFIEEFGTERLSDNFSQVEFKFPSQVIADFEFAIRGFYGLSLSVRKRFRR